MACVTTNYRTVGTLRTLPGPRATLEMTYHMFAILQDIVDDDHGRQTMEQSQAEMAVWLGKASDPWVSSDTRGGVHVRPGQVFRNSTPWCHVELFICSTTLRPID